MRTVRHIPGLLTIVAAVACTQAALRQPLPAASTPHSLIIEVTNKNFEDLVVYWRKGGVDIPIGVAEGLTTKRFAVHGAIIGSGVGVRLAAGRRGQTPWQVSDTFDAAQRNTVSWIVDYRLHSSAVIVR